MVDYMQGGPDSLAGRPRRHRGRATRADPSRLTARPTSRGPNRRRRPAAGGGPLRTATRCGSSSALVGDRRRRSVISRAFELPPRPATPTGSSSSLVAVVARRRRRVRPVLGDGPARRRPAAAVAGDGPALRVRRARRSSSSRVFLIYPVINTILISFKDAPVAGLRRARQLRVRLHRREHAAVDPQLGAVDRPRPARRRHHRARLRHPGRPAPPRRGGRQVDDLPADGDLASSAPPSRGG